MICISIKNYGFRFLKICIEKQILVDSDQLLTLPNMMSKAWLKRSMFPIVAWILDVIYLLAFLLVGLLAYLFALKVLPKVKNYLL